MFCKETSIMSTKTGAAIQVLPIPYANFSCFNDEIWEAKLAGITIEAVIKSTVLFLMSFATVSVNLIFLMVLRSPKYQRCVQVQCRYFLIAMSYNCILNGCCVLMFSTYTGIMDCWPFGEIVCQAQAILFGALNQHFCILIMSMGVDRYYSLAYPHKYSRRFTAKKIGVFIGFSWFGSVAMYCGLIIPEKSYEFNSNGVRMCEPFYGSNNLKLLGYCLFYFIPTLVLMHCYGNIFHSKHMQEMSRATKKATNHAYMNGGPTRCLNHDSINEGSTTNSSSGTSMPTVPQTTSVAAKLLFKSSLANPRQHLGILNLKQPSHRHALLAHPVIAAERRQHYNMARTMAGLSLNFIIVVTPWTLKEVVVSCTGTKFSPAWDFFITCLGMSYVLWNPFLFWFFNPKFQEAFKEFFREEILCQRPPDECCGSVHHHRVGTLFDQIHPIFIHPSIANNDNVTKSHSLMRPPNNHNKWSTGPSRSSVPNLHQKITSPNHLEATFIYPLNGRTSMSTPKLNPQTTEDLREKYWGEILERSLSQATINGVS